MNPGGILTTYCAKGVVRRMLQAAGFTVERLPALREVKEKFFGQPKKEPKNKQRSLPLPKETTIFVSHFQYDTNE